MTGTTTRRTEAGLPDRRARNPGRLPQREDPVRLNLWLPRDLREWLPAPAGAAVERLVRAGMAGRGEMNSPCLI